MYIYVYHIYMYIYIELIQKKNAIYFQAQTYFGVQTPGNIF